MDEKKTLNKKEEAQLEKLLAKVRTCECPIASGTAKTCFTDCKFYINGAYGGECAIEIIDDYIDTLRFKRK